MPGLASALTAARPLDAHLAFLHISMDAATFAATIMPEVIAGRFSRMSSIEWGRKPNNANRSKTAVQSFCRRRIGRRRNIGHAIRGLGKVASGRRL
jgi:hypothetical protein